jgi:hypothetical protein
MSDNIIRTNNVQNLSVMDVINNMQHKDGTLNISTKIEVNGQNYEFCLSEDSDGRVHATTNVVKEKGIFASLKRFFCGDKHASERMTVANEITRKMRDIIESNKYTQLTGNLLEFRAIVDKNLKAGNKNVEIADYGFAPNRDAVKLNKLLAKIRNEYADKNVNISFNQIDNYNSACKIKPSTLCIYPDARKVGQEGSIDDTLEKIKNGSIMEEFDPNWKIPQEKVEAWTNFLKREENLKKIDIPAKLNEYLHQPEGSVPEKSTGWKAEFKADPDKALRNFVIKNISYQYKDITPGELEQLVKDMKRYLDIMNTPDKTERDNALRDFFDAKNWRNEKEKKAYDEDLRTNISENPEYSEEEMTEYTDNQHHVGKTRRFQILNNVFVYATFRQTSKLGLEFFNEQKKPVMFQFADYNGSNIEGKFDSIANEMKDKKDEHGNFLFEKVGSPITHSEMRHAKRMQQRLDQQFEIHYVKGGLGKLVS